MRKQIWLDKERTSGVYPVFKRDDGVVVRGEFLFYMYDTKGIPPDIMYDTIVEWIKRRRDERILG